MSKGFLISAQNTLEVNYVKCAEVLAASIKRVMPTASITLVTHDSTNCKLFDYIVPLPHGDIDPNGKWKLANDWQVYEASPYDETIKLEADMFIPRNIEHLWDVLSVNDVVVSTGIKNFKGQQSNVRVYRKFIDDNELPDAYNAMTYFKKSDTAKEFFGIVRDVFENWEQYKAVMKCNPGEAVTTDWAYAIACHLMGVERTTLPLDEFSMVHMKQFVNELHSEDWTNELVYELLPNVIRINTYPQLYPIHYHVKEFSDKLRTAYGI